MIQPHPRIPLNELDAIHTRQLFESAPTSHEGLPLYLGAHVYVPVGNLLLRDSRVSGVVGIVVAGIGIDSVFFQHDRFNPLSRVRPGDCYFDAAKAFAVFAHNTELTRYAVDPSHILAAYQPPAPGEVSTVEMTA